MKFHEIARFLNISEPVAKSLAKQRIVPGRPLADGWETTSGKIEQWYVKLNGKEWANLVADGQVDPLAGGAYLAKKVTKNILLTALRSWEQRGTVKIISHNLELDVSPEVVIMLRGVAKAGKEGIESLKKDETLTESVRRDIELTYRCQIIVGENPVLVTIPEQNILRLSIEDAMAELPQREREIIRFYLTSQAFHLLTELQGKHEHK